MAINQLQVAQANGVIDKLQSIQDRAANIASPREILECLDSIVEMRNRDIR